MGVEFHCPTPDAKNCLCGILFPKREEAAYSNFRLWESVGFIIAYVYSPYLRTDVKLYILLVILIIGMICYVIIEVNEIKNLQKIKREKRQLALNGHNTSENDNQVGIVNDGFTKTE